MAIRYINNRQYPRHAVAVITASATEGTEILIPPRSLILSTGGLSVVDAFAGSSPTITIQDDSDTPVGYIEAESLGALAVHPLESDVAGKYYPAGAKLTITFGGTVTADSGKAIFHFAYIEELAENELYGRADG